MFKKFIKKYTREIICLALILIFFIMFTVRLFDWQIINGEYYRKEVSTTADFRLYSDATRGEIVDVNGEPIETNTTTYSVIIDKLYINGDLTVNDVIIRLFELFEKKNTNWIDTLPIVLDESGTYQFKEDEGGTELDTLRRDELLSLGVYADADDYMDKLIDRYGLEDCKDNKKLCRDLASVRCNMELELFSSSNPYTFAKDISQEMCAIISEYSQNMPCIDIATVSKRICTDGTLMPHILGVTGPLTAEEYEENKDKGYYYNDIIGKFGIEAACESYLKGEGGTKTVSKNADGTVVSVVDIEPAKPGNTVYLTIDKKIQQTANESLARNINEARTNGIALNAQNGNEGGYGEDCTAGAAVMLRVSDFGVLAASTYPTYDLTKYNNSDYYSSLLNDKTLPLYDRAFLGSFAPGSVVKPAVATAALEEGIITEFTSINCTKRYDYYPTNVVNCMGTHGYLDLAGAIARSCNFYFAEVGRRLGIDTMYLYLEKFSLGERTGLEVSEAKGFLAGRDSSTWFAGNTVQAAIGQSDNAFTPVQLATYVATIANNGVRLRTHLVDKVTSYDRTEVILDNAGSEPEVVEDLHITPYNMTTVQYSMRQVVDSEYGTANYMFGNYGVSMAAKTGTAENSGSDHTLFICYAPYEKPEVAVAVVLEHGAKGIYSMSVAKDMLDAYFFSSENSTAAPTE